MGSVLVNIISFVILLVFMFTKKFWEKNCISLSLVILLMFQFNQFLYQLDDIKIQVFLILSVLILDITIACFLFFCKIAGTRFLEVIQNYKTVFLIIFIFLIEDIIWWLNKGENDIYKLFANIFVSTIIPFLEEYGLRGIVFQKIQTQGCKWKRWTAYIIVSLLFMLGHGLVFLSGKLIFLGVIFLFSFILFGIRELWKSKYSFSLVLLLHVLYNSITFWF